VSQDVEKLILGLHAKKISNKRDGYW